MPLAGYDFWDGLTIEAEGGMFAGRHDTLFESCNTWDILRVRARYSFWGTGLSGKGQRAWIPPGPRRMTISHTTSYGTAILQKWCDHYFRGLISTHINSNNA